jgi:hypothetical protein
MEKFFIRTISFQSCLVIDVISKYCLSLVEEYCRLFRTSTSVNDFLKEFGIITARGFDEELLGGGTLRRPVSLCVYCTKTEIDICSSIAPTESSKEDGRGKNNMPRAPYLAQDEISNPPYCLQSPRRRRVSYV